jgi:hypothetical protein
VIPAIDDALERALVVAQPDDVVLIAGTTYVVGQARTILRHGAKGAG